MSTPWRTWRWRYSGAVTCRCWANGSRCRSLKHAGSTKIGDAVFDEIFHPIARELIDKCDAVLRIGGPSTGADDMVATGQKRGKRIFRDLSEIPERRRQAKR